MATTFANRDAVLDSSYLWFYWNNWANMNLRNVRESRLLFSIMIMIIKILPALFIKHQRCSIYTILANSLQWWVCKDMSLSAIIFYLLIISTTLRCMCRLSSWHLGDGKYWPTSPLLLSSSPLPLLSASHQYMWFDKLWAHYTTPQFPFFPDSTSF